MKVIISYRYTCIQIKREKIERELKKRKKVRGRKRDKDRERGSTYIFYDKNRIISCTLALLLIRERERERQREKLREKDRERKRERKYNLYKERYYQLQSCTLTFLLEREQIDRWRK